MARHGASGTRSTSVVANPRAPHSGFDGGPPRDGEWYGNVAPEALSQWLAHLPHVVRADPSRGDLYAVATKR